MVFTYTILFSESIDAYHLLVTLILDKYKES